jgi:transposase
MTLMRWVGRAIGLDVHRDFCVVAICEDGHVRSGTRVPSTPEGLEMLAQSLVKSDRVALEVTGSCWEVARILEPHVERVVVVSPDDTGITQARAKTDRLDERTLARLLWSGELESVWMPDVRCRVLRRRLARREQSVRARTRAKNEIHAVLQRRLQGKPPCSDLFGVKGRQWLAGLELPLEERESVDAAMRHVEFLDAEIAAAERLIAQQALEWPEIRRPGRQSDLRRDVHRRRREPLSVLEQPQAGRLPGPGSEGPPVRRRAGAQRPHQQTRLGGRPLGAGRGRLERRAAAGAAARLL